MKQNFSDEAKRALANASEAANGLGQDYIGSEHLLLGLLLTENTPAQVILEECGVEYDPFVEKLSQLTETGEPLKSGTAQLTPRAGRILQTAALESARHQEETGTEHILLAILSEGDCLATRILQLLGIDNAALYKSCREFLRESQAAEEPSAPHTSKHGAGKMKNLEKYGLDLTEEARKGKVE